SKFGEGWNRTWQVRRADYDKALNDELIKKGVDINFETEVTDVEFNNKNSSTTVVDSNGNTSKIHAKFVTDCSGYGRVLPRQLGLEIPSKLDPHSAIFTHIDDIRRPDGVEGTQISFDSIETEVWLWVIPFSNGKTSVGILG